MACLKVLVDISLTGVRIVMNCNYTSIGWRFEFGASVVRIAVLSCMGFIPLKVSNFGVLFDAVHIRDFTVEW